MSYEYTVIYNDDTKKMVEDGQNLISLGWKVTSAVFFDEDTGEDPAIYFQVFRLEL